MMRANGLTHAQMEIKITASKTIVTNTTVQIIHPMTYLLPLHVTILQK